MFEKLVHVKIYTKMLVFTMMMLIASVILDYLSRHVCCDPNADIFVFAIPLLVLSAGMTFFLPIIALHGYQELKKKTKKITPLKLLRYLNNTFWGAGSKYHIVEDYD